MAAEEIVQRPDRISMIRRALEEERTAVELYSRRAVIRKPWANARSQGALEGAFPDYEVEVEDAFESADKVTIRWRMRATHSGEFQGIKPSNVPINITGINVYRFVGDKIVESWGEFDALSLARQCERAGLGDAVIKVLNQGTTQTA